MDSFPRQANGNGWFSNMLGDTVAERSNAKLFNRFYEPLHLLRILNADRGPGEVDLPSASQSRGFKMSWRRFLDDLAWLCDNRHGGETVSAVAAQDLPDGVNFWLASKHEGSFNHLEWVLAELKISREQTNEGATAVASYIAARSIDFSKNKVKNYKRELTLALMKAKELRAAQGSIGTVEWTECERLFEELEFLTTVTDSPLGICYAAKRFSQWRILARLLRSNSSYEMYSPWASLWHYVGRLGCWFGKCENLVLTARQFPQLLENFNVEFLALPKPSTPPVDRSRVDLASALKRMLPAGQGDLALQLYEQLVGLRAFDIPGAFSDRLTDEKLTGSVHAEVYLMEHFYFHEFRFWAREKYIGCSKPSCYCCSLYFRYHPGNFVLRPAHNNVYVTWIPPLMNQVNEEPQRKHNLDIMNQMNAYIRRDVKEEIEDRIPRRQRAPDSTSGVNVSLSLGSD